jgi:hypothetical protein
MLRRLELKSTDTVHKVIHPTVLEPPQNINQHSRPHLELIIISEPNQYTKS